MLKTPTINKRNNINTLYEYYINKCLIVRRKHCRQHLAVYVSVNVIVYLITHSV